MRRKGKERRRNSRRKEREVKGRKKEGKQEEEKQEREKDGLPSGCHQTWAVFIILPESRDSYIIHNEGEGRKNNTRGESLWTN